MVMTQDTPVDPLPTHRHVAVWRFWFTNLLGWSEEQVLAFAKRWRDGILDEGSLHFHEVPEYWISLQFVPLEIREQHSPFVVERVAWVIYPLLERYRRTYGLTTEHFDTLQPQLHESISRRLEELAVARPQP